MVRDLTQDLGEEEELHLAPKPRAGELPSLQTDQFPTSPADSRGPMVSP